MSNFALDFEIILFRNLKTPLSRPASRRLPRRQPPQPDATKHINYL